MHTIFIKRCKEINLQRNIEGVKSVSNSSSLVKLNSKNSFSGRPCLKNSDKVIAYSKGKIARLPILPWER